MTSAPYPFQLVAGYLTNRAKLRRRVAHIDETADGTHPDTGILEHRLSFSGITGK
jgi:hypothetical protein